MGYGQIAAEAEAAAQADMAKVQAAANAISAAISKVQPWLSPETWAGHEAAAWTGEWKSFYATVQSCLNGLPAAEASVESAVRTKMDNLARQHAKQSAKQPA